MWYVREREGDLSREAYCRLPVRLWGFHMNSKQCWTHSVLPGCVCVVLSRWSLTESWYESAAQMQPGHVLLPCAPGEDRKLLCQENNYEYEDRKRGREEKKTTQCQLCTLWRDTGVTRLASKWMRSATMAVSSHPSRPSHWGRILKRWPEFLWITCVLFPPNNIISVHSG